MPDITLQEKRDLLYYNLRRALTGHKDSKFRLLKGNYLGKTYYQKSLVAVKDLQPCRLTLEVRQDPNLQVLVPNKAAGVWKNQWSEQFKKIREELKRYNLPVLLEQTKYEYNFCIVSRTLFDKAQKNTRMLKDEIHILNFKQDSKYRVADAQVFLSLVPFWVKRHNLHGAIRNCFNTMGVTIMGICFLKRIAAPDFELSECVKSFRTNLPHGDPRRMCAIDYEREITYEEAFYEFGKYLLRYSYEYPFHIQKLDADIVQKYERKRDGDKGPAVMILEPADSSVNMAARITQQTLEALKDKIVKYILAPAVTIFECDHWRHVTRRNLNDHAHCQQCESNCVDLFFGERATDNPLPDKVIKNKNLPRGEESRRSSSRTKDDGANLIVERVEDDADVDYAQSHRYRYQRPMTELEIAYQVRPELGLRNPTLSWPYPNPRYPKTLNPVPSEEDLRRREKLRREREEAERKEAERRERLKYLREVGQLSSTDWSSASSTPSDDDSDDPLHVPVGSFGKTLPQGPYHSNVRDTVMHRLPKRAKDADRYCGFSASYYPGRGGYPAFKKRLNRAIQRDDIEILDLSEVIQPRNGETPQERFKRQYKFNCLICPLWDPTTGVGEAAPRKSFAFKNLQDLGYHILSEEHTLTKKMQKMARRYPEKQRNGARELSVNNIDPEHFFE